MKLLIILSSALLLTAAYGQKTPSVAERDTRAKTALTTPNTIAIYTPGLCCPSCAIGIRKHISKLPFVDRKKKKSGVDLDAKAQLAIITLKAGQAPDADSLASAIRKAGYEGVELYQNQGGRISKSFMPKKR